MEMETNTHMYVHSQVVTFDDTSWTGTSLNDPLMTAGAVLAKLSSTIWPNRSFFDIE